MGVKNPGRADRDAHQVFGDDKWSAVARAHARKTLPEPRQVVLGVLWIPRSDTREVAENRARRPTWQ